MKHARYLTIIFLFTLFPLVNKAQVLDGLYVKEHTPQRKAIPYPSLREADVMWNKRVGGPLTLGKK